jgi:hypothetical protein
MPIDVAREAIEKSKGDPRIIEKLLSITPEGSLGNSPILIIIPSPTNYRIPNGNQFAANKDWIPGGFTKGGIPEAIIDLVLPAEYTYENVIKIGE